MAVFTPVTREQAQAFLADYTVGVLRGLRPIASGTENTNYFLDTDRGRYVLTLVERSEPQALDYVVALTVHLAERGLPCPAPLARRDGGRIGALAGRPALLLPRLPGASVAAPEPVHCRIAGGALAALHGAGRDFPRRRSASAADRPAASSPAYRPRRPICCTPNWRTRARPAWKNCRAGWCTATCSGTMCSFGTGNWAA